MRIVSTLNQGSLLCRSRALMRPVKVAVMSVLTLITQHAVNCAAGYRGSSSASLV